MNRFRWLKVMKVALFIAVAVAACSWIVMSLWNWLFPALFGWHTLDWGKALGILVLSRILFGGLRGHRPPWAGGNHRRRWQARWKQMSPEEQTKFREGLRGHCGGPRP